MTIAVNAVTPAFKPAAGFFFQQAFFEMAAAHPQHQFLLVGFTAYEDCPPNCSIILPGKTIKSPLAFLYWLNYRLPALLKKNKAALLFTYNSCSLRTSLPQMLFLDDAGFLHNTGAYTNSWLLFDKKYTGKFLHKAAHVTTASAFLQAEIEEQYKMAAAKCAIVYAAAPAVFKPAVHWNINDTVKEQLTAGREYFLYTGPVHTSQNLINLLKAFSFFKQRQKSNMQLVLATASAAEAAFVKSLSSYKYRQEVVLAENTRLDELVKITAAAYALVSPVLHHASGSEVLQAMQCATPVIVSGSGAMPEICGDAAAYCDAADFNDIAAKMMLLFTNEDRRNQLVAKSRDRMQLFSIGQSAQQLWQLAQGKA